MAMEVVFIKKHTHKGTTYYAGDTLDASDNEVVTLLSRGAAEKVKGKSPKPKPTPSFDETPETETSVGDTDGPATDE